MVKKKSILMTILLLIPMLLAIGFSSWIIIYEVLIHPNYIEPSGLSKYFDNYQTTTYNGVVQFPTQTSGDTISSELLSYKYKLESETDDKYVQCSDTVGPKNAGTYSVLISKTENEITETCLVTYVINKATPSVEVPTIVPNEIYEGQSANFNGGAAYFTNDKVSIDVEGVFSYTSSKGTTELKFSGYNEKSDNKVNMTFTPKKGEETGDINFKSITFQVDIKLKHISYIDGYIDGNPKKLYFGSIEAALEYANNIEESTMKTVMVVPELKEEDDDGNPIKYSPIIKSNCTINNGVTLTLPFEGETYDGRQRGEEDKSDKYYTSDAGDRFADETQELINDYLMTNVIIEEGISLIINSGGTLNIGGVTGNEADPSKQDTTYHNTDDIVLCGQTSGKYCQITLSEKSKIISSGEIYCYGYIKESSKDNDSMLEINDGILSLPFVIYDYQGGWETIGAFCTDSSKLTTVGSTDSVMVTSATNKAGNVSPFSIFDLPNVQSLIKFGYNAYLIGNADIYSRATTVAFISVPNTHNTTKINVIGTENSIINLKTGAYALLKYSASSDGFTLKDNINGKTKIKIYGGASSGIMKLSLKAAFIDVNVKTDNVFFPVSWKYDIELYDGNYSIANKIKFMGGSSLYVGKDAVLTVDSDTAIYPVTSGNNYIYPENQKSNYGKFIVDGNTTINAPFSGNILTNSVDSFLTVNNITPALSTEGIGEKDGSTNSKFTVTLVINENMNGNINLVENEIFEKNAYISETQTDTNNQNKLTWSIAEGYTDYSITYDANGGSFSGNSTKTESYLIKDGTTVKVSNITSSGPTRDHYTFEGWYTVATNPEEKDLLTNVYVTDPAGTAKAETIIAYAKWTEKTYTIKYEINYQGEAEKTNQINNNTSEYKYSSTSISFSLPTDGDYRFSGWYIDEDYQNPFDISKSYSGSELFAKADAEGLLTLYGYFTDLVEYTVNFDTDTPDKDYGFESIKVVKNNFIENLDDEYSSQLELQNDNTLYSRYFVGWYSDIEKTQQFTNTTPVKSNMTLYAKWEDKEKTIEFYIGTELNKTIGIPNGGVTLSNTYWYIPGSTVTFSQPDPIEQGHKFLGWATADGSFTFKTSSDITVSVLETNSITKLYASYEVNTCKITITMDSNVTSHNVKADGVPVISGNSYKYGSEISDITAEYADNYEKDSTKISPDTNLYNSKYLIGEITIDFKSKEKCIVSGTLITLADGSKKLVDDITYEDEILVFNHETGKWDVSRMLFITHEDEGFKEYETITLHFSNNYSITIVGEHGFYDMDLMRYVFINKNNIDSFIGHKFYSAELINNELDIDYIELLSYEIKTEYTKIYCPVTAYHMNSFNNGLLAMPNFPYGAEGLVNIFEYDDDLKFNEEKMKADIEKYGIFEYEYFKDYFSYEAYLASPAVYLKVSIGKGYLTHEQMMLVIEYLLTGDLIE